MRGFRHRRPSPDEVKAFRSEDPSSDAYSKYRLMHEVAEEKRRHLNSERREKRAKGKFWELKDKVEELETVIRATSDERERNLKKRRDRLRQEVARLTARFKSRVRRAPKDRDHSAAGSRTYPHRLSNHL